MGLLGRVIVALALLAGLVAVASPASAHVNFDLIEPSDGGRLAQAPETITISVSEPLQAGEVEVRITGQRTQTDVSLGPGRKGVRAFTLDYPVASPMPEDSYLVELAGVGLDGHRVLEVFEFVVGEGPHIRPNGVVTGGSVRPGTQATTTAAKYLGLVALPVLFIPFMLTFVFKQGLRLPEIPLLTVLAGLVCGSAALVELMCQDSVARGIGLGEWNGAYFIDSLDRPFGRLLLVRAAAATCLAWILLRLRNRALLGHRTDRHENAAMLAALVLLFSIAAAGHAGADPWALVMTCLSSVHVGSIALWGGGVLFWVLWFAHTRTLTANPAEQHMPVVSTMEGARVVDTSSWAGDAGADTFVRLHPEVVRRFSTLAKWCVLAAVSSGLLLAARLTIGSTGLPTGYGLVAVLKGGAVLMLLVVALGSHRRWSSADPSRSQPALRRCLLCELLVGACTMLTGALLATLQ